MQIAKEKPAVFQHLDTIKPEEWQRFFDAYRLAASINPGRVLGGDVIEQDGEQLIQMPFFNYRDEWIRWEVSFYDDHIFFPADWMSWFPEIDETWRPTDEAEAVMALVLYIRRNRFMDGGLADNILSGEVDHAMRLLMETYGHEGTSN